MRTKIAALFFLAIFSVGSRLGFCPDEIAILSKAGPVLGRSHNGVSRFLGIPYAHATRWQPPTEPLPSIHPLHAFELAPTCPQWPIELGGPSGHHVSSMQSEDCLNLNIWAPRPKDELRPVMLWLHGGGFSRGGNSSPVYDGQRLAGRGDVVVVVINYRLGPLGFFAHPQLSRESGVGASGNYGLMDQMAALRWVQNNIQAFGGDPKNVTLFGESAGGYAICDLMGSPLASGLFQRAIVQSAACVDQAQTAAQREAVGLHTAKALGCEDIACLRGKSPAELFAAWKFDGDPNLSYFPHVDGHVIVETPSSRLGKKGFAALPLLIGVNSNEATPRLFTEKIERARDFTAYVQNAWPKAAAQILEQYPVRSDHEAHAVFLQLMTDLVFTCPALAMANAIAMRQQPVYFYRFAYKKGAHHAGEIPFVFGNLREPTTADRDLSDRVIDYWSAFARGEDLSLYGWPAFQSKNVPYLQLDTPIRVGQDLGAKVCSLF